MKGTIEYKNRAEDSGGFMRSEEEMKKFYEKIMILYLIF